MILTSLSSTTQPDGWLAPITERLLPGDYTALVFTFRDDAVFDAEAASRLDGKPVVVLDFAEYGYSSWEHTHMLGDNSVFERSVPNPGYYQWLSEWVSRQNVVCYFKRELTQALRYENRFMHKFPIYPIELLSSKVPYALPPTKDEWMSRQGGVFHLYGHSHPWRKRLHAAMQEGFSHVVNSLRAACCVPFEIGQYHLAEQANYWDRYPLSDVLLVQSKFALSVALPGYGMKCFRHMESCFACVPVIREKPLEWSIPWTSENSVQIDTVGGPLVCAELMQALRDHESLYPKAVAAHETCMRYRPVGYIEHIINPLIRKHL